jgi:hypothetical protein
MANYGLLCPFGRFASQQFFIPATASALPLPKKYMSTLRFQLSPDDSQRSLT